MSKHFHEIRDPIHGFVRLDSDERKVLDSRPFQRLRHIHQLGMTYLLYPAATHKRFEHSLGVMELAGRVFDIVTNPAHITDAIRRELPELSQPDKLGYWRRVLRMAALCHDMGHLPFSHAAEEELLPKDWNHERLTHQIILLKEMEQIWNWITPPLRAVDIVKLALGPREMEGEPFSPWEAVLSEIIVGDSFGVDRMDYLLRDSHHIGVAYGKFDHFRLIDTLCILLTDSGPALGVEEGGLHSAEALLLARYYMYTQVYFHPIRRIYDIFLRDFLVAWLPDGKFATDLETHLSLTDNQVLVAIQEASQDPGKPGHEAARRIVSHEHFKVLYARHPDDVRVNPEAGAAVTAGAQKEFGTDNVRRDAYKQKRSTTLFPVLLRDGRIVDSGKLSEVLVHLPVVDIDFVYIRPDLLQAATDWLRENRDSIIKAEQEE